MKFDLQKSLFVCFSVYFLKDYHKLLSNNLPVSSRNLSFSLHIKFATLLLQSVSCFFLFINRIIDICQTQLFTSYISIVNESKKFVFVIPYYYYYYCNYWIYWISESLFFLCLTVAAVFYWNIEKCCKQRHVHNLQLLWSVETIQLGWTFQFSSHPLKLSLFLNPIL